MPLLNAPLTVSGQHILDATGTSVRLAGVNWGGAHQDGLVPAGLDKLHRDVIARRIRDWGLNHVRLPFALGTFVTNTGALRTGPAATSRLAANPDLAGASPWEVYQACVTSLTAAGLAVIPNQHLLWPGWCCSAADNNGLWYNGNWPPSTFYSCWRLVANAFAASPLVIGYDLHNEPRPADSSGGVVTPTWGDGNAATDMRLMYATLIPQLAAVSGPPGKLWFCEGLNYASDLTRAGTDPVGPDGTVYSLHDYAWFHPAGQPQSSYFNQMYGNGGYIPVTGQAPLWIGEVGASTDVPTAQLGAGWLGNFLAWARSTGVHWCWWELSAQAVKGTEPTTNVLKAQDGQRESYGLMAGHDWNGDQTELLALLTPLMS